jgi:hypothetical protein
MPDELKDLVAAAAARDQLNASAWVREVLSAAASSPLTLPEILTALRSDSPDQLNGSHRWRLNGHRRGSDQQQLGAQVIARSCLHRADQIVRFPTFRRCLGCNTEWPV